MNKKKVIGISLGVLVGLIGIYSGAKNIYSKSELIGKVSLFNNLEKGFNLEDVTEEETLSLKEIEEENAVIENNKNVESVVVNNPVVEIKETKNVITKEEVLKRTETKPKTEVVNEVVQNVVETKNEKENVKEEKFVKLVKNESVVANMQAMMFALLPTDWFFSNSKVVIDSDGIDENTEYVTFDKLNQELLKNRKAGDIKIFAYDEIWNNGTSDYVRKTRCYIR